MKSIKIVLAISAILGVALLNSASAGAAKYITEDVENNPDYRFLRQRLVKMEIDEDEEIDWEEFAKHIFVPSKTKCRLAKAFIGADAYLVDVFMNYGFKKSDIQNLPIRTIFHYGSDHIPSDDEGRIRDIHNIDLNDLKSSLINIQKSPSITKNRVNATLHLPIGAYWDDDLNNPDDPARLSVGKYFIADDGTIGKGNPLTVPFSELKEKETKNYVDMAGLIVSDKAGIASCGGHPEVLIFEEFDLIINRKSTQPQDSDKEDSTSTKTETPTPQDAVKETVTTQQEVQQISAPNTGFSNFNPISILALLGLTSTATFIFRRK